ncbi:MAG: type I restriction enzyme HsdR N-terminal domain-containing protein [Bacteroidales bacterium]|nr:type I restriction enzyme HsdR N-terminal domain-containing protein [Bacteroidales bacterium]
MAGGKTIRDPLRKKEVVLTPEEQVRQWFIGLLKDRYGVPEHMMSSEVPFTFGNKHYRADIVVWGRDLAPRILVECKRPEVTLDEKVLSQAVDYNRVLDVPYMVITNGLKTYALSRADNGDYSFIQEIPQFSLIR